MKWNSIVACFCAFLGVIIGPGSYVHGGQVAYWSFDEGTGTTFHDSVGGNHGTLNRDLFAAGKMGSALHFEGSDWGIVPSSPDLELTGSMTMEAWVKADTLNQHGYIWDAILCQGPWQGHGYSLWAQLQADHFASYFLTSSGYTAVSTPIPDTTGWHHLAGTYDQPTGVSKLYLDGGLVGSDDRAGGAMASSGQDVAIGSTADLTHGFRGFVDEVTIWDEALSENQILYRSRGRPDPELPPVTPDLYDVTKVHGVWQKGYTGHGVTIGQVESGFPTSSHPALYAQATGEIWSAVHYPSPKNMIHAAEVAGVAGGKTTLFSTSMGISVLADRYNEQWGEAITKDTPVNYAGVAPDSQIRGWAVGAFGTALGDAYHAADDLASNGADVINNSSADPFTFAESNPDLESVWEAALDLIVEKYGVSVTNAAGNVIDIYKAWNVARPSGPILGTVISPGGSYNSITVGMSNLHGNYVHDESASGSQPDSLGRVRCKPDIVAPGEGVVLVNESSGSLTYDQGTSYAAPQVAGAIALLLEAGREGTESGRSDLANSEHPLVIKSVLLNSAEKLPDWRQDTVMRNWNGESVSVHYDHSIPLDLRQGAGQLNVSRGLEHLLAGERSPGFVPSQGWSLEVIDESAQHAYFLENEIPGDAMIIGTISWYRHVQDGLLPGTYVMVPLADLNLALLGPDGRGGEHWVDWSESAVDNVEHIYTKAAFSGQYAFLVDGVDQIAAEGEKYSFSWRVVLPTVGIENGNFVTNDALGWHLNRDFGVIPEPSTTGSAAVIPDPANPENSVARLTAGSPASISQLIETPEEAFYLEFDYSFAQVGGSLSVFLDDEIIGEPILGADIQTNQWFTALLEVDEQSVLGREDVVLAFVFDGTLGDVIFLDGISSHPIPEPATMTLMTLGGIAILRRRRKQ